MIHTIFPGKISFIHKYKYHIIQILCLIFVKFILICQIVTCQYILDGSLPDPARSQQPPPPIKPEPQNIPRKNVERHGSSSTHLTEKYDLEESSEFLQPIDDRPPIIVDEDDYQALEETKTQIHPPNTQSFFTYNR